MIDYYNAYKDILKILVERAVREDNYWNYCHLLCLIGEVVLRISRIISDFEEKSNYWGE